jgi:hypothetical protein
MGQEEKKKRRRNPRYQIMMRAQTGVSSKHEVEELRWKWN